MIRRDFLQKTTAATLGLAAASFPSSARNGAPPSDQLRLGVIGVNGMGFADLRAHLKVPNVTCVALADVDANVLEKRAGEVQQQTGKRPATFGDFRKMLELKDLDAVIIGTPDHWHTLPAIYAMEAGKDIYCEKPLANSIEECRLIEAAAKRYNRVVQVGQWQRSHQHWQDALAFVRSGKLGNVRLVKVWGYFNWYKEVPPLPDGPAPAGVDYAMWLGPATKRPFNPNRFHGTWRHFWDYGGGLMTDWGVHLIDMALAGMNATTPLSVSAAGGKFGYPDSPMETPDTMQALYQFPTFSLVWAHGVGIGNGDYGREHGVAFVGNTSTLVVDRGGWEVIPEKKDGKNLMEAVPRTAQVGNGLDNHAANFVACVRSRQRTNCPVDVAANTALVCQLGNIAYRTGHKLDWDATKGTFANDKAANDLVAAQYHNGWKVPRV
jgi:predicted dehydrogenase